MTSATGSSLDRKAAKHHIETARAALQALDLAMRTEGEPIPATTISREVRAAISALNAFDGLMLAEGDADAEPSRVPCAFCGKMIMSAATLCGFCWRRRAEPAAAHPATAGAVVATSR